MNWERLESDVVLLDDALKRLRLKDPHAEEQLNLVRSLAHRMAWAMETLVVLRKTRKMEQIGMGN